MIYQKGIFISEITKPFLLQEFISLCRVLWHLSQSQITFNHGSLHKIRDVLLIYPP